MGFEECWEHHCYLTLSREKMAGKITEGHTRVYIFLSFFFCRCTLFAKLINNSTISQGTRPARIKPSLINGSETRQVPCLAHISLHAQHTPQRAPWNTNVFNTSYTRPCPADPRCHIISYTLLDYYYSIVGAFI